MREGLTFDDVLLQPKFSNVKSRRDVNTKTRLTKNITINVPVISANMDTVTESAMAICMAELGGMGIIHRFLTLERQINEVVKVKRAHNFIIQDPYTIELTSTIEQVKDIMYHRGVHSLLVINSDKRLQGIVTNRDLLFEDDYSLQVSKVMTPLEKLIYKKVRSISEIDFEEAKKLLKIHKLEKLPLTDENGFIKGLITVKDIEKRLEFPDAVKDDHGRLMVGAAIGVKNDYLERAQELVKVGVDLLVIDIAHGHAQNLLDTLYKIKSDFSGVDVIAGNVATKHGTMDLIAAGADAIKCGIGGGCFKAGARVLMANGTYKNIEEIVIGDRVINKDGKAVNVTNAFCTGVKKVVKLRNSVFYEDTFVTPDHQYWIGDLNTVSHETLQSKGYVKLLEQESKTTPKQSKYKWKPVCEFNQSALLLPKNIEFDLKNDFSIELKTRVSGNKTENILYATEMVLKPSYDLGYIFGTFLGDGTANCSFNEVKNSRSGKIVWAFGLKETDIAEKLQEAVYRIFKKEVFSSNENNTIQVTLYYKPFADFLNNFGKKENKHLPSEFFVNNPEYLKGILDGLIDSDGYVEKEGRINFYNTSKQLIELFNISCYLVNGVFPNNSKPQKTTGGLENINIENCNQSYYASIINTGKKRLTENYQVVKLLEIEETDIEVPVYDITVDCETHSFIANNAIVHNSTCVTRLVTGSGVPQLTAVMDCCDAAVYKDVPVISDGGIRYSGDIVKALAGGASSVMLGSLFAGCEESPGLTRIIDGHKLKVYRGMASFDAAANRIDAEKGYEVNLNDYVPEGIETVMPYKGRTKEVMEQLIGGLRSGMSYLGVNSIEDLPKNADFIKISSAGWTESKPHAKK